MSALRTVGYAAGASLPLMLGAGVGVVWKPPQRLLGTMLAFAAGALISAVAFELFEEGYRGGGAVRAGLAFGAGALVFVLLDVLLERVQRQAASSFALLAAVTLDGIPENTALGVTLGGAGSVALLVAVFVSNVPESLAGAAGMRESGRSTTQVLALWGGATVLLFSAVVLGALAFDGASDEALAVPLAFAAGAVLASVIDTLAPEAFEDGGPFVALASAAGFLTAFLLAV